MKDDRKLKDLQACYQALEERNCAMWVMIARRDTELRFAKTQNVGLAAKLIAVEEMNKLLKEKINSLENKKAKGVPESLRTNERVRQFNRGGPFVAPAACELKGVGAGTTGVKDDSGKLRYDLIPGDWTQGDAEVLTFGARKYAPNGWKTVPRAKDRYFAAAMRHLHAWYYDGEKFDKETGLSHLKHARCNLGFLLTLYK